MDSRINGNVRLNIQANKLMRCKGLTATMQPKNHQINDLLLFLQRNKNMNITFVRLNIAQP